MQFEFPGSVAVPDGRYLARGDRERESVLVVETLGVPPPPSRRRRRPLEGNDAIEPPSVPLARVTAVRAWEPFESSEAGSHWLGEAVSAREEVDRLVSEGIGLLNRALHAGAVADGEARFREEVPERAVCVRIGYGTGEEVFAGRFSVAHDIELQGREGSRRERRAHDLRPQEGIAAALGGRALPDVCETLLLRVRAELDSGRLREAALQLAPALRALLLELAGASVDPAHEQDMAAIDARLAEADAAAGIALHGDLDPQSEGQVRELAALGERVLRRRRIRRG